MNRLDRRTRLMAVCAFLAILLGAGVALLPVPYAVLSPGPVTNTLGEHDGKPLITVKGRQTYPTDGRLDFTTVQLRGGPGYPLDLFTALRGWVSREESVVPVETVFPPGETSEQVKRENAAEMVSSQKKAAVAALTELGIRVPSTVGIADVASSSPAKGKVRVGDRVVAVDGRPTATAQDVREAVGDRRPGQSVDLTLVRGGQRLDVTTGTTSSQGRTVVGLVLEPDYDLPVDVRIDAGDVGGPSAGMMFALAVYDLLTPGELTGGQHIAGTGTIEATGEVGPIGGIQQKLVGAERAGARWFLAPAGNCGQVVGNVPEGLRVVRTATLHESRLAVEAIAAGRGADLPTCTR